MTEHATTNDSSIDGAASVLDDGLGSKWCYYCRKDTHNDAECHSTRPKDWQPTCQPALTLCPTCGNDFRKCVAMRPNVEVQRDSGSIIAGGSAGTTGSAAGDSEKG